MRNLLLVVLLCGSFSVHAQIQSASLKAAGLTCAMCSKAVLTSLQGVSFVADVDVDMNSQDYLLTFKPGVEVNVDVLKAAVEEAGFSVASLHLLMPDVLPAVGADGHMSIGAHTYHFMPGTAATAGIWQVIDKGFASDKETRKWKGAAKAACIRDGKKASCCPRGASDRIIHLAPIG